MVASGEWALETFLPDHLDSLRRVVADGRTDLAIKQSLPGDVSLATAAEFACWSSTPQFLGNAPLTAHFRAWCKRAPVANAAAKALRAIPSIVQGGVTPMAFLPCIVDEREVERDQGRLTAFGVGFIEAAVRVSRFDKAWSSGLWKTVADLIDNVVVHAQIPSDAPCRALAAYRADPCYFEFVVADVGRGVLSSLRDNPLHRQLTTSADALRAIVRDGATRSRGIGREGGGIQVMFRKIASRRGVMRFRSGDGVLSIDGDLDRARERSSPSPTMPGFQAYVRLHAPTKSAMPP